MGGLNQFYKDNVTPANTEIEFPLSDRFVEKDGDGNTVYDENGEPKYIKFKMRSLKPKKLMDLSTGVVNAKGGVNIGEASNTSLALIAECLVYPNLRDAGLQDSYGVTSAEDLANEMFTAGEIKDLITKASNLHDGDKTMEDMVDDVKNS